MLYLTCTMIASVDLAYYRVSRAKDWVSVDCGTKSPYYFNVLLLFFDNDLRPDFTSKLLVRLTN